MVFLIAMASAVLVVAVVVSAAVHHAGAFSYIVRSWRNEKIQGHVIVIVILTVILIGLVVIVIVNKQML